MAELIAALITIHGFTFLADMYVFLDPLGGSVRLSVKYPSLHPVDHMVGECRIILFCKVG